MSREWYLFFQAVFERIGGTNGQSAEALALMPTLAAIGEGDAQADLVPTQAPVPFDELERLTFDSQLAAMREDVAVLLNRPPGMVIKRIIRSVLTFGTSVTSASFTITPALSSLDKAELRLLGSSTLATGFNAACVRIQLDSLTSLSGIRSIGSGATEVSFELTEYV
jgi:hypothetical protein